MKGKYVCGDCGAVRCLDNVLYLQVACECGKMMSLQNQFISESSTPHIASKPHLEHTSLMGKAFEIEYDFFNPKQTVVNVGRKDNIDGLKFIAYKYAVVNKTEKVPLRAMFHYAKRIEGVKDETAREYIETLKHCFDYDNYHLIVDLNKAKEIVGEI